MFEVERGKVDDGLDLLRKDFQARHLVPDKRLTNAAQTNQAKMFLVSYNTMMILYWETQFNLFYFFMYVLLRHNGSKTYSSIHTQSYTQMHPLKTQKDFKTSKNGKKEQNW